MMLTRFDRSLYILTVAFTEGFGCVCVLLSSFIGNAKTTWELDWLCFP